MNATTTTARKKKFIFLAASAFLMVTVGTVLLGVLLTQALPDGEALAAALLPQSTTASMLVAEYVTTNGQNVTIARSYDGNPWEPVAGVNSQTATVICNTQNVCSLVTSVAYSVREVGVPQELLALSSEQLAARLYMQATFGASKVELASVVSQYGTNYSRWILEQILLPPTFARSYYRQRANARPGEYNEDDFVQHCDIGSRWHRFTFEMRDRSKILAVALNGSLKRFMLRIDGSLRGEVSSFLGQPYPGTALGIVFPATFFICTVDETIDGPVVLSMDNGTTCNYTWSNPAISITNVNIGQTLGQADAQLVPVFGSRPGSFVLTSRTVPCNATMDARGNAFVRQGNSTYRFDQRIRLLENTLENPARVDDDFLGICPVVAKSYQNRDYCVRRTVCLYEACGSPAEASTIPELGAHYAVYNNPTNGPSVEYLEHPIPAGYDRIFVLNNVALKAADQLRQRVAWSLSNIFTLGSDPGVPLETDAWTAYYDTFIRNAFGNFFDILRDVSYHPLMGSYLTYLQNKAYAVQSTYPDENYAREVMQLFSIGLWKLNDNGTRQLDADGQPMETYTNADILDFARAWTGFDRQASRTNLGVHEAKPQNNLDPMQIKAVWHDRLPKAKLDDGYLGDGYPLCDELPSKGYLRKGARFEFTGDVSAEGPTLDAEDPLVVGSRPRFAPTPSSSPSLYYYLCSPQANGTCSFPLQVSLPRNVPCRGQECNAGRVISVKIVDPITNETNYYTYVPPACTRLTFFNNGLLLKRSKTVTQCADPATQVGSPVCCRSTDLTRAATNYTSECLFTNEVTNYPTTSSRCASLGLEVCSSGLVNTASFAITCAKDAYMWTSGACSLQLQVYSSGQIGLVDPAAPQFRLLSSNSNDVFRVRWTNDIYPVAQNAQCPTLCTPLLTSDGYSCLCNFTVANGLVFNRANLPNSNQAVNVITRRCTIGANDPLLVYANGTYSQCTLAECTALNNVIVWLHKDDLSGVLSERTIFQLPAARQGGRVRYLFNRQSVVNVGSFSFRNPPHFAPLVGELTDLSRDYTSDSLWTRKAEYEVNALLEHLAEHQSTAPFVAYRLIQHMVTSNPSPNYMKRVVSAFRSGSYGNTTFSGKYGDLGATVYAILMDQEARSPTLEADPDFGMLKDPLVKFFQFIRALQYSSPKQREVSLIDMNSRIGVQVFGAPSVFGFYLPEFSPSPLAELGLVSPQSQLATAPNILGFLNGVTSLVDNGLTSCDSGFATTANHGGRRCSKPSELADGFLTYQPQSSNATEIVEELNTVLAAGRFHQSTRDTLVREYNAALAKSDSAPDALKQVLNLIAATSEYQTTSLNLLTNVTRQAPPSVPSGGRRFKAIVVVFEIGGFDSFNLIVPHSNCTQKDLYAEYQTVRGAAALSNAELLRIATPVGTQPCRYFGVHPALPELQTLYKNGDALFVANIGAMVEPINKTEYMAGTKQVPPSLFAHNVMQRNVQNVHAQDLSAEGVLGRITEALLAGTPPYKSSIFSFAGNAKMVQGSLPPNFISPTNGVVQLRQLSKVQAGLNNITQYTSDSIFADLYADQLFNSLNTSQTLGDLMSRATLNTTFGSSSLDLQMQQVAKLIKMLSTEQGMERAVFFTQTGGFDTHASFDLSPMLAPVNSALGSFAREMKAQGRWNDVVVVSASDFGRTLASNGRGTDHAWGGNHFVAGGKVKGNQILGSYPNTLTDEFELSLGRGRLIPSTPFEAVWQGISEWFGVPADKMTQVVPNAANFPANQLFDATQLFQA
jgi:cullin-associated NEDD8-dissociated protein 1